MIFPFAATIAATNAANMARRRREKMELESKEKVNDVSENDIEVFSFEQTDYDLDRLIKKLKEIKSEETVSKYATCADCKRIHNIIDALIEFAEKYRR